jgi:hypothetical protein
MILRLRAIAGQVLVPILTRIIFGIRSRGVREEVGSPLGSPVAFRYEYTLSPRPASLGASMKEPFGPGRYLDLADQALRDKPKKPRPKKLPIEEIFQRAMGREMTNSERKAFRLTPKRSPRAA